MAPLVIQDKARELDNDVNSTTLFSSSCAVTSISIPVDGVCPPATTFTWNNGSLHIVSGGHYQLNGSNIFNACSFVVGGVFPGSYTITATFSTTGCGTSSLSCTTTLNCNGATCDNADCIPT